MDGSLRDPPDFRLQKGMNAIKWNPQYNLIFDYWTELLKKFISNFTDGNQFKYLDKLVSLITKSQKKQTFFVAFLSQARVEGHGDWSRGYWYGKCMSFHFIFELISLYYQYNLSVEDDYSVILRDLLSNSKTYLQLLSEVFDEVRKMQSDISTSNCGPQVTSEEVIFE